jgi:hypothetical protein
MVPQLTLDSGHSKQRLTWKNLSPRGASVQFAARGAVHAKMDWKGKLRLFRHFLCPLVLDQRRRLCSSRLAPPLLCTVTLAPAFRPLVRQLSETPMTGLSSRLSRRPSNASVRWAVGSGVGGHDFSGQSLAPQPPTNLFR